MSDKVAKEKEAGEAEAKKQAEEAAKKLWVIQIVHDGEKGVTFVQQGQNVTQRWQIDLMIDNAYKNKETIRLGRILIELLKGQGVIKPVKKPGMFHK